MLACERDAVERKCSWAILKQKWRGAVKDKVSIWDKITSVIPVYWWQSGRKKKMKEIFRNEWEDLLANLQMDERVAACGDANYNVCIEKYGWWMQGECKNHEYALIKGSQHWPLYRRSSKLDNWLERSLNRTLGRKSSKLDNWWENLWIGHLVGSGHFPRQDCALDSQHLECVAYL